MGSSHMGDLLVVRATVSSQARGTCVRRCSVAADSCCFTIS